MTLLDRHVKIVDDKNELMKSIKSVDWNRFVEWGSVRVIIKNGKPVSAYVEQRIDID